MARAITAPLLKVKIGERATWFNDDGAPHSIAVKNGAASDKVMPGQSYSLTFDKFGDYDYLCTIHPYMTGKIVVTPEMSAMGVP